MPSPNSATLTYTSRIRVFGHIASISTVYQASRPLRSQLRPCHRNRFLAVCWLMVLAPRTRLPRALWSIAFSIASRSKPGCVAKCWSSAAITASGRCGEICARSRQSWATRKSQSPWRQASPWRASMKAEVGGSTKRSTATCSTLAASHSSGSHSSQRQRRRRGRVSMVSGMALPLSGCARGNDNAPATPARFRAWIPNPPRN